MVVLLSTDVNRNGYRVLTGGVNIENYKKNPVLLFVHARPQSWDRDRLPIGKLENVRLDDQGRLVADDPIFDEEDEFALKIKKKWDKGILRAVSVGLDVFTVSDEPQFLQIGQTRPTVVSAELLEVSVVDIPADATAVRLSSGEKEGLDQILPKIIQQHKSSEMNKEIALALGLPENATAEQCVAAIKQRNQEIEDLRAAQIDELLALGEQRGVVNDENREHWRELAKQSLKSTAALIKQVKPTEKNTEKNGGEATVKQLLAQAKANGAGGAAPDDSNRDNWTFDDWSKKDEAGLLQMKQQNPEKYKQLAQAYEPK